MLIGITDNYNIFFSISLAQRTTHLLDLKTKHVIYHHDLPEHSAFMDSIKTAVQNYRQNSADEELFISHLNELVSQHGDDACKVIFNTLATLDLPAAQAAEYWQLVQNHRKDLKNKLGRKVGLITAISDFLDTASQTPVMHNLVDSSIFERTVKGTTHDNLTGLFNRTYFDDTYSQQVSFARRYRGELSILFLDIDDFKEINDNLGHIAGDKALKKVAEIIDRTKRESDIAARYGGEEFVLLMPHTDSGNAYSLAERIRTELEKTAFEYNGQTFSLTVSGGLASFPGNSTDPENLLHMADSAVYLAKGSGKNIICQFKEEKRRYLRMNIQQPLLIQELGFYKRQAKPAMSKNISMGGILLTCKQPIPIGTIMQVNVPIDNTNPLLLIGRVVRVEKVSEEQYDIGMSISFNEMAKEANSEISCFLKSMLMDDELLISNLDLS